MPFTDTFVTLKMTWWIFNGKCHKAILLISLTIYNKAKKQKDWKRNGGEGQGQRQGGR